MADIQAFRGLRFDLSKVGSLSDVVAPPDDVLSSSDRDELLRRNEFNIVRLILPQEDAGAPGKSVYENAATTIRSWRRDRILRPDPVATIYVYHQDYELDGQRYNRKGFLSRVKLEPSGEGKIYAHEETDSRPKEDRYRLVMACEANLSPIFSIYSDPDNEAQQILESAIEDNTPFVAIDSDGVEHRLWRVTDTDSIARVSAILGAAPAYIADGHHHYETSCRIREDALKSGIAGAKDYALMMFTSMHDPGLAVLPTHRLFRGLAPIDSESLTEKLQRCFDLEAIAVGPEGAESTWELIQLEDQQSTIGLYCRTDDTWLLARLNVGGWEKLERSAPEQSDQWRGLGVSILHRLIIDDLLEGRDLPTPKYVHSVSEVVEGLINGDSSERDVTGQSASGSAFELASLVMPAGVDDVKIISEQGLRMPAKSTYFYPKLLSGLVINPLDE